MASDNFNNNITPSQVNLNIINYYNTTQWFYNFFWATSGSLAMHYGIWDDTTKNLKSAQLNENKLISELLNLKSSDVVMDAGCGVGGTIIWMAKNYGCRVIGFTICLKQVELGKKYIKKNKITHLAEIVLKDFCDTEFPDCYFSKIFGIESICYAANQEKFAREVFRLLKPNGRFVRADGFLTSKNLAPKAKKIYTDWCEGWAVPGLGTVDEYCRLLSDVGFINIEATEITHNIIPSAKRMWWINLPFYPLFYILYKLKIITRTSFMDIVASLSQKRLFLEGITSYVIITADKP